MSTYMKNLLLSAGAHVTVLPPAEGASLGLPSSWGHSAWWVWQEGDGICLNVVLMTQLRYAIDKLMITVICSHECVHIGYQNSVKRRKKMGIYP